MAGSDDRGGNPDQRTGEQLARRTGRPCRLITELGLADRYFAAYAVVGSIGIAARSVGVSRSSVMRTLALGRQEEHGPFRHFADRHARVRDEKVVGLAQLIERAAIKDWRAASWLLERLAPQQFGRQAVEVRVPDPVRVQAEAWLDEVAGKAKTVREIYDQADTVEKMRAVITRDMQRRAERRAQLLRERSGNEAAGRDDAEGTG